MTIATTAYVPRAGSVAANALELLLARESAMTAEDICDEIDADKRSFQTNIGIALREGVIAVVQQGGRNFYSVGNGQPVPDLAAAEQAAAEPPKPPTPFKRWLKKKGEASAEAPRKKRGAKALPPAKGKTAPVRKPARTKRKQPTTTTDERAVVVAGNQVSSSWPMPPPSASGKSGIACALFNTGDLLIEVGEEPCLRLSREQTIELVAYLSQLNLIAGDAARAR